MAHAPASLFSAAFLWVYLSKTYLYMWRATCWCLRLRVCVCVCVGSHVVAGRGPASLAPLGRVLTYISCVCVCVCVGSYAVGASLAPLRRVFNDIPFSLTLTRTLEQVRRILPQLPPTHDYHPTFEPTYSREEIERFKPPIVPPSTVAPAQWSPKG